MTRGTGAGAGEDYPSVLASLSGLTAFNYGVPGETASQILTRILADTPSPDDVHIFWMGNNNDPPTIVDEITAAVEHVAPNSKFLLLSILNRAEEVKGTVMHNAITASNAVDMALYPGHGFDVRAWAVHQYNRSDPTDVLNHLSDIPPASLRFDNIHWLAPLYARLAGRIYDLTNDAGWLAAA